MNNKLNLSPFNKEIDTIHTTSLKKEGEVQQFSNVSLSFRRQPF